MNDKETNLRIAEAICETFSWEDRTFKEGDYVALLDGKIVVVGETPDQAITALRALDPDPKRGMVLVVSHPVVDVIR